MSINGRTVKRALTGIAAVASLLLLSFAVPAGAAAQTAGTAHTHSASHTQSVLDDPCLQAIAVAVVEVKVDGYLRDRLKVPKEATALTVEEITPDVAQLAYDVQGKKLFSVPFDVSSVVYDVLGLIPGTSKLWAAGGPATTCLKEAVIADIQAGINEGHQLRKDLDNYLYGLIPTGLTVRAKPSDGTVLLLSWHPHTVGLPMWVVTSFLKPGFQISDGHTSHSTSADHYTWRGLAPGTKVCFKVRATFTLGDSGWAHACGTTSSPSSPPPAACTPSISSVGSFTATGTQTVQISGSCFGTGNTSSGADTPYFRITDVTANWNACWTNDPGTDSITCSVSSWTNNEITFTGFNGGYGTGTWVVNSGDLIKIQVWNAQSGKGPATYEVTAGGSADCCVT
jgi:hypothetical protein